MYCTHFLLEKNPNIAKTGTPADRACNQQTRILLAYTIITSTPASRLHNSNDQRLLNHLSSSLASEPLPTERAERRGALKFRLNLLVFSRVYELGCEFPVSSADFWLCLRKFCGKADRGRLAGQRREFKIHRKSTAQVVIFRKTCNFYLVV